MTLDHLTIMTPSTDSSNIQPTPERSSPGHHWKPHSSTLLPGLLCNIEPTTSSHCWDLSPSEFGPLYDHRDSLAPAWSTAGGFEVASIVAYPSPPPTTSNPKRSVPLPSVTFHSGCRSSPFALGSSTKPVMQYLRFLDSPTSMLHEPSTPLSPPPTIPTTTHALPSDSNTLAFTLPPTPEEDEGDISEDDLHFDSHVPIGPLTFADHAESSASTHLLSPVHEESPLTQASEAAQLLSPLSPEWNPTGIQFPAPHNTEYSLLSHDNGDYSLRRFIDPEETRPILSPLDIPEGSSSPLFVEAPVSGDEDHAMDVDPEYSPEDPEELFTPRTPEAIEPPYLGDLHDLYSKMDFDHFGDDDFTSFPHPSSPSISTHGLPELEFEDDDSHPSPPLSLISLPGADIDDDLIPVDLALPSYHPDTPTSPASLLLVDEAGRSISPDAADPDPDLAVVLSETLNRTDTPELRRLQSVRSRALAAERVARQKEAAALEQGAIIARTEARREKKKEKERAREVSALLRLKLGLAEQRQDETSEADLIFGDDVEMEERAGIDGMVKKKKKSKSKAKNVAGNMDTLVARMIFRRRNETTKPLPNRQAEVFQRSVYTPSSLSCSPSFTSPDDNEDDLMDEDSLDDLVTPVAGGLKNAASSDDMSVDIVEECVPGEVS